MPSKHIRRLHTVVDFLNSIGISAKIQETPVESSFLPGVAIRSGSLICSEEALPSDLLHEAGHLACLPEPWRSSANGNLFATFRKMLSDIENLPFDSPVAISAMQSGDTEATAWAWAAGKAIGLPEDLIIVDEQYDGTGADIRLALRHSAYLGINGLSRAGFCANSSRVAQSRSVYPRLDHWLQPASL